MKTGAELTVIEPEPRLEVESTALEMVVDTLERLGGNPEALADKFDADKRLVLFQLQKRLKEHHNPRLRERWEGAIQLFKSTEMLLLQIDSIKMVKHLNPDDDKAARIELALFKIVMGDVLTGATIAARQQAANKSDASSILSDAISVMEGADDAEFA